MPIQAGGLGITSAEISRPPTAWTGKFGPASLMIEVDQIVWILGAGMAAVGFVVLLRVLRIPRDDGRDFEPADEYRRRRATIRESIARFRDACGP